eukprot:CAMPEP_0174329420 /NCGR_PEP_ID=MMETSP0810-20121108/15830_1 /TAXON_ID=73025 ORGANISM="Eutreptiella gymnastica-like, Strain CCMP1594" /NCGR_SAMPLE_ID=MMETSP0810 /ASSEMBLY_ACC=CAM_ASM_000659 /LENGTH=95 /DNA_ID=CAMNT_0015443911 /DNA_START=353 /DNA_END=640 /DNA_ORIENTATION=+
MGHTPAHRHRPQARVAGVWGRSTVQQGLETGRPAVSVQVSHGMQRHRRTEGACQNQHFPTTKGTPSSTLQHKIGKWARKARKGKHSTVQRAYIAI